MTSFTERLEQYLAHRRRHGGDWTAAARILHPFVAFADAEAAEWIGVDLFMGWKDLSGSAGTATWNNRLSAVRGFTAWLKDIDPRTEVPPKELIPRRYQRPTPHIYSDGEIAQILTEAAQLPSRLGLRGETYATLFGLLAVTGLRIGEALGLDDRDVDLDAAVLFVRRGKNGKSRFIPVTDCTAERLGQYRAARSKIFGTAATEAFFVGENGKRLEIHAAQSNFAKIGQKIGLREKQPGTKFGRGPRLHDMRHTMASKTILDWFRSGRNPDREMYKLSTYLGHGNPGDTYCHAARGMTVRMPTIRQCRARRDRALNQRGSGPLSLGITPAAIPGRVRLSLNKRRACNACNIQVPRPCGDPSGRVRRPLPFLRRRASESARGKALGEPARQLPVHSPSLPDLAQPRRD